MAIKNPFSGLVTLTEKTVVEKAGHSPMGEDIKSGWNSVIDYVWTEEETKKVFEVTPVEKE